MILFPMCNYKSDKRNLFTFWLFFVYGMFMLISCLVETNIISQQSICDWGGRGGHSKLCMDASGGA
jgi:hypothetical protein